MEQVFDLHLHSKYSDGDLSVNQLIEAMAGTGVLGVSLTDHNGVWGMDEAGRMAHSLGLEFIQGIEISCRFQDYDLHILGYSHNFNLRFLREGLAGTIKGYQTRMEYMAELCQEAGYLGVTVDEIVMERAEQEDPCFNSYDIGKLLKKYHGMSHQEARSLTASGGICHVSYGDWALSPVEAIDLIHRAGGIAIWAHPGFALSDLGADTLTQYIGQFVDFGLDGLEINHPAQSSKSKELLRVSAHKNSLLITGGSDWHGPGRYESSDSQLGKAGIGRVDYELLKPKLS